MSISPSRSSPRHATAACINFPKICGEFMTRKATKETTHIFSAMAARMALDVMAQAPDETQGCS